MRRAASQLLAATAAARTSGVVSCSSRTEGAAAAFAAATNRSFSSSSSSSAAATAESAPSTSTSSLHVADEPFCRQRQLIVLGNRVPTLSPDAWVAPNAVLVGDVDLYDKVTVFHGSVLRGDLNAVRVGAGSTIGSRCVLHAARSSPTGLPAATSVGRDVTVGDRCLLRSATVGDGAVLGEGSILLEGSVVGAGAVLGPGTVVPPGRLVPAGELWAGKPARFVRALTKDERAATAAVAAESGASRAGGYAQHELPEGGMRYKAVEALREALSGK